MSALWIALVVWLALWALNVRLAKGAVSRTRMGKALVPLRRFLQPQESAHLAVYLGSAESDGMTGQSILLDGGMLMV